MSLVYWYWLIFDMTHDCGHVIYVFRTWLIVMSHGFHACDPLGHMTGLMGLIGDEI